MTYQDPKVNWTSVDGVTYDDLNRIEGNSSALKEQIDNLSATGIPALVTYEYDIPVDTEGQTIFNIPYLYYNKTTDKLIVAPSGIDAPIAYTITEPVEVDSVITPGYITFAAGRTKGPGAFVKMRIFKNAPIGPEGAINGAVLAEGTMPINRIVGSDTLALKENIPGYNYIINENFDIWQRYISFTNPATNSYIADRFVVYQANTGTFPSSIIHSKQPIVPGELLNSSYCYRITTNGAGTLNANDCYLLNQYIENGVRKLCGLGKKVTLSFKARSNIDNKKIGVFFQQNYGTGGSAQDLIAGNHFTLNSTWQKFSVTIDTKDLVGKVFGLNNDDCFKVLFALAYGSGVYSASVGDTVAETFGGVGYIDIAQVKLESGDKATPFVPRLIAEEELLCKRYYERIIGTIRIIGTSHGVPSGGNEVCQAIFMIRMNAPKRNNGSTLVSGLTSLSWVEIPGTAAQTITGSLILGSITDTAVYFRITYTSTLAYSTIIPFYLNLNSTDYIAIDGEIY